MKNIMTMRRPLELLHMDLFGPNAYKSLGGNSFSLIIVDELSRFTWVFFLDDKSQVQKILKNFIRKAQNQFEVKIKKVRSDNGTEFKNANVDTFLDEEGISHEFSATYTPQQNGVVERKNRTLIEMARTMLDEYKTPKHFWAEAVETACHATNRLYLHKLLGRRHTSFLPVTNPKLDTFEYSAQSATFLINIVILNLLLNLMKVSYSVMAQTLTHTVSRKISPERLKRR